MKYHYYPGCSLQGTAKEYDLSTRALMGALGVELVDVPDWTCCGATAAPALSRLLALSLPARNLALAEASGEALDILVPCSACYLNLKQAEEGVRQGGETRREINEILAEVGLTCHGTTRVRHLLDVLSTDLRGAFPKERMKQSFSGLRIAPYYGCQCLRPYGEFDDPEDPRTMEPLIQATGAEVFPWTAGAHCCGASHMTTKPGIGIELVAGILEAAAGADAIVTVCPMCQMNLEAYQEKASRSRGRDLKATILYLPQLLGLGLGLSKEDVRLDLNLAIGGAFKVKAA